MLNLAGSSATALRSFLSGKKALEKRGGHNAGGPFTRLKSDENDACSDACLKFVTKGDSHVQPSMRSLSKLFLCLLRRTPLKKTFDRMEGHGRPKPRSVV